MVDEEAHTKSHQYVEEELQVHHPYPAIPPTNAAAIVPYHAVRVRVLSDMVGNDRL